MSLAIAPNRSQSRRKIVLGAATVLLHLVVLDWFSGQLGRPRAERVRRDPAQVEAALIETRQPIILQLRLQQRLQQRPQPIPIEPALKPPPLPRLPPEPVAVAEAGTPDGADAGDGTQAPAADAGPGAQAAGQASAAAGAADVQSHQAAAAGAQARPAAQQPQQQPHPQQAPPEPVREARHYKVDLPPSADITLDVARTDANGTRWSGDALLSWTLMPASYKIRVEAGISVVFAHVNLLTLTSEGMVGEEGFMPSLMTEKRRGRAMTATHFNRTNGKLSFSASEANYPLVWGAQDKASVPLQLAAIARGDPKQLSGNIDILVGEDRDASVFSFVVVGQEQIDTRMGRIATWHLTRPPKPGSYNSRLDLWLAPERGWYPVQIRNVEASGAVTTQTVNNIVMKDSGS
jgi:hypothetical protein